MTITSIALALISTGAGFAGAIIGAAATIASARLTERAIRDRESVFKVWERRADAIEEAHRKMLALANSRDLAWARRQLPSGLSPAELDPGHQDEQFRLVVTKLTLYTTPELVKAYQDSNAAFMKSLLGVQRVELALAETGSESDRSRRQLNINTAVGVATRAIEEAKAADERLATVLREAASLGVPSVRRR
ncbi:hypothetical protein [Streptomyces sp. NPDC002758]